MSESFQFVPQKLVYGGEALGHHEGHPVLVPRALPGERVEVEAVRTAKGVVHARLLRVLVAAPERVDPPCPYFGNCGGCQYQHLGPEHQTAWKSEILRETLRRIGRIIWDAEIPVHTAHPWNYRNQAQLKVTHTADGQSSVGFFEAESHRLVPVDACLIIPPRLNAILRELRRPEWCGSVPGLPSRLIECREIEMLADDQDEQVMLTLRGSISRMDGEGLAEDLLHELPGVETVAIDRGGEPRIFGKPALVYRVGDFRYQISPGSFFQASRFLVPELVAAVVGEGFALPRAAAGRPYLALDLFAGVGFFTLPLARRFDQVVGVEPNARSAADLAANVQAHALTNVRAVPQTAFDFLRRFAQAEPDLVILDPPREGVAVKELKLLAGLRPRRIHYVSCHPPTLARDLGYLVDRGYRLESIELFDFFPQTFHIESLARLTRRAE